MRRPPVVTRGDPAASAALRRQAEELRAQAGADAIRNTHAAHELREQAEQLDDIADEAEAS